MAPEITDAQTIETERPDPVGNGEYVIRQGDCIESIAYRHGHFWETVWNDPENSELKRTRESPNYLLPGDRLHVPEIKVESCGAASEQRHTYRRLGVPSKVRIVVRRSEGVRAVEPYSLTVDGKLFTGDTDGQGVIELTIPPDAKHCHLTVGQGEEEVEYDWRLGSLNPLAELSGIQGRLNNLGFDCGSADGEMTPATSAAIKAFQCKAGLPETGQPDQATMDALREEHGS